MNGEYGGDYQGDDRRGIQVARHEFEKLTTWVKEIDSVLRAHTEQEAVLFERQSKMDENIEHMDTKLDDLLDVFKQAKGGVRVLLWIAGLVGTLFTIGSWLKDHIKL